MYECQFYSSGKCTNDTIPENYCEYGTNCLPKELKTRIEQLEVELKHQSKLTLDQQDISLSYWKEIKDLEAENKKLVEANEDKIHTICIDNIKISKLVKQNEMLTKMMNILHDKVCGDSSLEDK